MSVASNPSPITFMSHPQPGAGFEWNETEAGLILRCRPLLDVADHAFTTRDLLLTHDAAEWAAVAGLMRVVPGRLRLIRQVHGADVAVVRRGREVPRSRPDADVIVSDDDRS